MRRRNPLPFVLFLAAFCAFSNIQPAMALGLLGARAGVTLASASFDTQATFDEQNRTGFAGTVFLTTGMAGLTLQPEASYIQKGVANGGTGGDVELDYFELAALVKIGIMLPVVHPHLFGGLGFDFEVNKSSPVDFPTSSEDFNLILGADGEFPLGPVVIVGDARYALGLKDVSEASDLVSDLKNKAWILSAGVALPF